MSERDRIADEYGDAYEDWTYEISVGHFKAGWDARDAEIAQLKDLLRRAMDALRLRTWKEDERDSHFPRCDARCPEETWSNKCTCGLRTANETLTALRAAGFGGPDGK